MNSAGRLLRYGRLSRRTLLLSTVFPAFAQDPDFSAGVEVVTLLATVHDKYGNVVRDLNQDDFLVKEDGVSQEIRYFSRESDLPLTIGLLVDTSRSQTGVLEPERQASYRFLDQVLREDTDRAFLVHFDEKVEILQGLTSSRKELSAALRKLEIPGKFATLIFNAIRTASEQVMKREPGRKALVLLSDGVEFRDPTPITDAIEYAQRADTIIYSIRFADHIQLYRPGKAMVRAVAGERGKKALERLSRETGGGYFEVSDGNTIDKIYGQIEKELRNQYSLGYTPQRNGKAAGFHRISATAKKTDLIVKTREGYYAH
jgi:VWFA-related protein